MKIFDILCILLGIFVLVAVGIETLHKRDFQIATFVMPACLFLISVACLVL